MSPRGHYLTAIGVGIASSVAWARLSGPADGPGGLGLAALMGGFLAGARAPDVLEIATFVGGERASVIPHRTLTHWIPLWVLALYAAFLVCTETQAALWLRALVAGFVAAGALHVLMDFFTPTGVPLLLPVPRARVRMPLYHTGKFGEELVVLVFLAAVGISTTLMLAAPMAKPPW